MLSSSELASLRATQERTMDTDCVVQRPSRTSDGKGGKTVTETTVATTKCRINPSGRSPEERMIADRAQAVGTYTLSMPAGTNVTAKDIVVAGSRQFEVLGVIIRSLETARRVVCLEVD